MARTTKRGRKSRSRTGIDKRQLELETLRNRRYIAFVRAVIGAARTRKSCCTHPWAPWAEPAAVSPG